MPRIFDNIETPLLPALSDSLEVAHRADFCVGYFNLRGWKRLYSHVERWEGGDGKCARVLVGMQKPPQEELREFFSLSKREEGLDNATALRLKKKWAEEFRQQLMTGAPSDEDETTLRRLSAQLKSGKVVVKLFLRHSLHAKLYLCFRNDKQNPVTGFLGSSNLTLSGLAYQGELNVDVLDHDATKKLVNWFEDRWADKWCIDISKELAQIIDESWSRSDLIPPYHIYLKMAYHLSNEARAGLAEFRIPRDFGTTLFDFQTAAVKIAAHHLNKRNGVIIGDVVGLGKTLMATALARIFEDDQGLETLIVCPRNLVPMWEDYRERYRLRARIVSLSMAIKELPLLKRYRLVILDESHNLRNREGKTYRVIREYLQENESKVILLSATPYNKTYLDLSSQLRLFVSEEQDLGIRPERLLREIGETEFIRKHQCPVRSLAAFEKSEYADDWRELMRLYLVRRTRTFIKANYALTDSNDGRKYLLLESGDRSYFPDRVPRTVRFGVNADDPNDQYAKLFAADVVTTINGLRLPRYGLGNYVAPSPKTPPTPQEKVVLDNLSRAGQRLKGFSRTNLFKRLESSGQAFLLSVERHTLRNFVYLHAIENNLPVPIGTQDSHDLDSRTTDEDNDATESENGERLATPTSGIAGSGLRAEEEFKRRAAAIYADYQTRATSQFRWVAPHLFTRNLTRDLTSDSRNLIEVLQKVPEWSGEKDPKLHALLDLLREKHPAEKVIIFTQFADTVLYLEREFARRGIKDQAGVTGASENPTALAHRFSPESNKKRDLIPKSQELRVLAATDVLSEGQNLQDAAIVVNYDLPWAIIRLIQRAGRVDRIGQKANRILCYSFLPADGVERVIQLRQTVRQRLQENAEVVGTDEAFFDDDQNNTALIDLYNERAGILDGDDDKDVDLASFAYQIWKNAITKQPELQKAIEDLPDVVYSTKSIPPAPASPEGVLVYVRTAQGNDALAWVDRTGKSVTESQFEILKIAECGPDTPALPRDGQHHDLVRKGIMHIANEETNVGGQLGRPSGARFRAYDRLKRYADKYRGTFHVSKELLLAIDDIYQYPLKQTGVDALNRQLRAGISDEQLADLVVALRDEDRLSIVHEGPESSQEPRIICSMGLLRGKE